MAPCKVNTFCPARGPKAMRYVHAVQHQTVQVNVEIGRRPKSLNQRDCAAVGLKGLETGLVEQVARDHPVHHLKHRRYQQRLRGQQQAQRDRQRQHPLAHRHARR